MNSSHLIRKPAKRNKKDHAPPQSLIFVLPWNWLTPLSFTLNWPELIQSYLTGKYRLYFRQSSTQLKGMGIISREKGDNSFSHAIPGHLTLGKPLYLGLSFPISKVRESGQIVSLQSFSGQKFYNSVTFFFIVPLNLDKSDVIQVKGDLSANYMA